MCIIITESDLHVFTLLGGINVSEPKLISQLCYYTQFDWCSTLVVTVGCVPTNYTGCASRVLEWHRESLVVGLSQHTGGGYQSSCFHMCIDKHSNQTAKMAKLKVILTFSEDSDCQLFTSSPIQTQKKHIVHTHTYTHTHRYTHTAGGSQSQPATCSPVPAAEAHS